MEAEPAAEAIVRILNNALVLNGFAGMMKMPALIEV